MNSNWIKKGIILLPKKKHWWQKSHIMLPTVEHLERDNFRIYFSGRDKFNKSIIGYADSIVRDGLIKIKRYEENPILTCGKLGTFDDNGVTPSCIINNNGVKYLYYIGWNSGSTTRMGLIAGLAISKDNGKTFLRNSFAPLLGRSNLEPYSILTAPFVIKEKKMWRMYYVSCEGWLNKDLPIYNIKYAESINGIDWKRNGHICIDFKSKDETALARPCVIKEGELYKMWYSYKDPKIGYRIGYAESPDGLKWKRIDDNEGLGVSKEGWDSDMVEYSYVFKHKNIKYMIYNGNNYGSNGAGYAVHK